MMTHIFFSGKLPRWLGFDRGPITIIGNRATPHQGQIFESAGRKTSFAPSYRMVIDLATDEVNTPLPVVRPTGGFPNGTVRIFSTGFMGNTKNSALRQKMGILNLNKDDKSHVSDYYIYQ